MAIELMGDSKSSHNNNIFYKTHAVYGKNLSEVRRIFNEKMLSLTEKLGDSGVIIWRGFPAFDQSEGRVGIMCRFATIPDIESGLEKKEGEGATSLDGNVPSLGTGIGDKSWITSECLDDLESLIKEIKGSEVDFDTKTHIMSKTSATKIQDFVSHYESLT